MAVTEKTGDSQTAVIGTEHTLATVTDAGIYQIRVDLNALAAGDIIELRVYAKCRNATDPERLIEGPAVFGPIVPDQKLTECRPVQSAGHFKATLKQTTGTGRAFPWVILSTGA